jgi:cyclophilin family peptidyl-prolyl cis-trans isomerase
MAGAQVRACVRARVHVLPLLNHHNMFPLKRFSRARSPPAPAAAVLPFQSYGALGMARSEFEPDSASTQFFWLLFESDLTPAGKNMLDGRYNCFGYTVDGAELLKDVKEGDIVVSAKVTKGLENLVR